MLGGHIGGGKRNVTLKDETGRITFTIWKENARDFTGKAGSVILIKNGQRRTAGAVALITTVEVTTFRVTNKCSKIVYLKLPTYNLVYFFRSTQRDAQ